MTTTTSTLPTMQDLFVDPQSLPSPSMSVLEIIRRADEPEVAMSDIAELVEADVAVAVQVLRMANSALYAPGREITTIQRALAALGLRTVKLLALTTSLRSLIPQQSDAIDTNEIRHRMVVMASVARRAAQLIEPARRDEAFVAGLLTGIGPVVLATEAPEATKMVLGTSPVWPDPEREFEVLGFTTDEISTELVSQWGLSSVFVDALRHRRDETITVDDNDEGDVSIRPFLQLASIAEPILMGRGTSTQVEAVRQILADVSEMTAEEADTWLADAESVVSETSEMLQFRVPQEVAYAQLVAEASERLMSLQQSLETQLFVADESVDELAKRNDELEAEASTDALTKMPNRRAFDRQLAALMETASPGLGLLVLDLDHFKSVNDTHGHSVGDDVLRCVGSTLQSQTRGDDFAARFGGEEFVMLIPQTSRDRLFAIAERLRAAVADLVIDLPDGRSLTVTTSIGGAMLGSSTDITTGRTLLEAADAQLYQAKQGGRNRTCLL